MSHFHDLHFSESILCHRLWDVFFFPPLLIRRSPFDRRQNPLGLWQPTPFISCHFPKKTAWLLPARLSFCVSVVSRWAALRSRHVSAVFLAQFMAVVKPARLSVVLTDWWTMAALTGSSVGRQMYELFILKILLGEVVVHHPSSYQPRTVSSGKSSTELSNERCSVKKHNWNVTEGERFPKVQALSF